MRCPTSSGIHVVPLPMALKLSIHLSGGEEGGVVDLRRSDRQHDNRREERGRKKKKNQATVTPDHYSSVDILNKMSKSEAS